MSDLENKLIATADNNNLTIINKPLNVYNKLLDKSSERLAKEYFEKAKNFGRNNKEPLKAKEFYIKAIDLKPDFEEAYQNYGYLLGIVFKDYNKAIEIFSILLKLNPKNKLAYYKRSQFKGNLKNFKGELEDFNEYMKLTKINSETYFSRALIKRRMNDYDGIIDDCTKGIELDKNNNLLFNMLLSIRGVAKFNLKNYEEAIVDFKHSIEIIIERNKITNKSENFGWQNLEYYGKSKFELKEYKSALKIFFKCIEQYPKYHFIYEQIAKVFDKLNDSENHKLYIEKFNILNDEHLKKNYNRLIKETN